MDNLDFESSNFYEILGISKTASLQEIKKAYHKTALKVHPDRNPNDKEANSKFQKLGKIYETLSDPDKRGYYDETGKILDDNAEDFLHQERDWDEYWRILFKKISEEDINSFSKCYKGSEEEKAEVLKYYTQFKGNMKKILESVILSEDEDLPRFIDIIETAIKENKVKSYVQFEKSCKQLQSKSTQKKRQEDREKEAQELEELKRQILSKNSNSLTTTRKATIGENHFNSVVDQLASKYVEGENEGQPKKKENQRKISASKTSYEEIPEEEFQKIQNNLMKRKEQENFMEEDNEDRKISKKKKTKRTKRN